MRNPYLERVKARGKGHAGQRSERRLAKSISARLRPASGALSGAKGDMVKSAVEKWLIESKSTVASSFRVELDKLRKISDEAIEANALPMMTVSFTDRNGAPVPNGEWAMIPVGLLHLLDGFEK